MAPPKKSGYHLSKSDVKELFRDMEEYGGLYDCAFKDMYKSSTTLKKKYFSSEQRHACTQKIAIQRRSTVMSYYNKLLDLEIAEHKNTWDRMKAEEDKQNGEDEDEDEIAAEDDGEDPDPEFPAHDSYHDEEERLAAERAEEEAEANVNAESSSKSRRRTTRASSAASQQSTGSSVSRRSLRSSMMTPPRTITRKTTAFSSPGRRSTAKKPPTVPYDFDSSSEDDMEGHVVGYTGMPSPLAFIMPSNLGSFKSPFVFHVPPKGGVFLGFTFQLVPKVVKSLQGMGMNASRNVWTIKYSYDAPDYDNWKAIYCGLPEDSPYRRRAIMVKGPKTSYFSCDTSQQLKVMRAFKGQNFEGLTGAILQMENEKTAAAAAKLSVNEFNELDKANDDAKTDPFVIEEKDFCHWIFLFPTERPPLTNSVYGVENILGKGILPMKLKKNTYGISKQDINAMVGYFVIAEEEKDLSKNKSISTDSARAIDFDDIHSDDEIPAVDLN